MPVPPNNDLALISLRGPDARELLRNTCTGDLSEERTAPASLNAFCNNKGRVISLFFVLMHEDCCSLVVPASLQDRLIKLLTLYRLRAKVEITKDDGARVATLAQACPGQIDLSAKDRFPLGAIDEAAPGSDASPIIASIGRRLPRSLIIATKENLDRIPGKGQDPSESGQAWRLAALIDAQPWLEAEQSESFLPQSLCLDREPLGVCSLSKGCYPGQEIVARMHYLGKRKRALHWLWGEGGLTQGQSLRSGPDAKDCGTVLEAAPTADPGKPTLALAELAIGAAESGALVDADGGQWACQRCWAEQV